MKSQNQKKKFLNFLTTSLVLSLMSSLLLPGISHSKTLITSRIVSKASETSKGPTSLKQEDNPLGPGHKITHKTDINSQPTLGGAPSSERKPAEQNSMPGGIAISTDPGTRPDLSRFKKNLFTDLFGKEIDHSRGEDDLSKLKGMAESLLLIFGSSTDDPGEDSQAGDKPYSKEESMVGADGDQKSGGTTGSTIAPSTYDDEGVHAADGGKTAKDYQGSALGSIGTALGTGLPKTNTGQALQQALNEQDGKSSSSNSDSSGSNNSANNNSGNNNSGNGSSGNSGSGGTEDPNPITDYHTSTDGKTSVWKYKDGTTVVRNNETQTTTTQYPDGTIVDEDKDGNKTTTKPPSMPDPDHQTASLPAVIQKQLDADLAALRAIGPKKEPGNIDFGGEGSDAGMPVGQVDKNAKIPDKKKGLSDPATPEEQSTERPSLDQQNPQQGPNENVIHVL